MKAYKVQWTRAARKDVREIKRHIKIDSPWYSESVTRDIVLSAGEIGLKVNRFTICPEWKDENTRHRLVHGYRIIYEIQKTRVLILGVINERRLLRNVDDRF